MQDIERTARCWSEQKAWKVGRGLYWTELPAVLRRLNAKVSGDPNTDWVTYTLNTYLAGRLPLERCLSLGCGKGGLERHLASLGAFTACDAYDVAPGAIDTACQLAAAQGYQHIRYAVADINRLELPERSYNVVWVSGAMHHFARLERICAQIQRSLKSQGLLILNEYVGLSRFQFSVRQREIMQAALILLPLRYRRLAPERIEGDLARSPGRKGIQWLLRRLIDKIRDRDLLVAIQRRWATYQAAQHKTDLFKRTLTFPTVRDVVAADPSESVRSGEILDVLPRFFELVEVKKLGGGLLQFLLDGIAYNFEENDPQAMMMLDLLFQIEDRLMACGELKSDFVYVVARSRRRGIGV